MDDWFLALGFSMAEADKLFKVLDDDGSGSLSLAEFARGCLQLRNPVKAVDLALVQYNMRVMTEEICDRLEYNSGLLTDLLWKESGSGGARSSEMGSLSE